MTTLSSISQTVRPSKLPIVVDNPTSEPGLGFDRYVDGIAAAVLGGSPARYTVGLYGPWGSGKSSLLSAVEKVVNIQRYTSDEAPYVVRFDAWRYEKSESLIFPLLYAVKRVVESDKRPGSKKAVEIASSIGRLLETLEVSFLGVGLKYAKGKASGGEEYTSPFEGMESLSLQLGGNRRIIILVDDLDRCTPDGVVNVLEAIHLLTDVDGFVFVLALDYEYLINAIRTRYKDQEMNPHRFIEKIVQVPFHIPRPDVGEKALVDIIRTWETDLKTPWFDGVSEKQIETIIYSALRSNPRQVKRLFNTFLLARFMDWERVDRSELVLRVLGLQLAWPTEFRILHEAIAAVHRDRNESTETTLSEVFAFNSMTAEAPGLNQDDEDDLQAESPLSAYLKEVIRGDVRLAEILPVMSLTENVAQSDGPLNNGQPPALTRFETSLQKVKVDLGRLYEELCLFAKELGDDVKKKPAQNFMGFVCASSSSNRSEFFLSINVRPKADRLLIFLPIPVVGRTETGFIRDVSNLGHHGNGGFEISLNPGDLPKVARAKEYIQQSYELVRRGK